jgi:hypothetical protein
MCSFSGRGGRRNDSRHRSNEDPNLFWVCELYADTDACAVHREGNAMATSTPMLGARIAESERIGGEPVATKGLPTCRMPPLPGGLHVKEGAASPPPDSGGRIGPQVQHGLR